MPIFRVLDISKVLNIPRVLKLLTGTAFFFTLLTFCNKVEDPSLYPLFDPAQVKAPPEIPTSTYNENRNVFWGDLHIHTSLSADAYTMGVRSLPEDAYTYMKGGTIKHGMGYAIRAVRPLDFGAVTDHSEFLGVARKVAPDENENNELRSIMESGSRWLITWNFLKTVFYLMGSSDAKWEDFGPDWLEKTQKSAWQEVIDAAERHNKPGVFSTFIAYEWSSIPDMNNLHRNVIYKGSQVPDYPFSSMDSENPEDLWDALDRQREQGMEVFAIPHNSNLSNGLMYRALDYDGEPITEAYAQQREFNEPISEILQVKGASETHPILSPDDELANFEIYDQRLAVDGSDSAPKGSYARDALRTGIELAHSEGFNPFRFGVIGSSDSHNASFSAEEDNYHGKLPLLDGTAGLRLGVSNFLPKSQNRGGRWSAMGLVAVWAEENTRDSLFDAMRRRETYSTSGPRISVRFFAGWDYQPQLLEQKNAIEQAYLRGVPMGGQLMAAPGMRSPVFAVMAAKDPQGANLDRIQIIKGWVDKSGNSHERIFNVAASNNRQPDESGSLVAVGNTVDVASATYSNNIGASQLATLWHDPEFNNAQQAFYYARVIEIPTPRFTTYDAFKMGVEAPSPEAIQERAITSAIWYQP